MSTHSSAQSPRDDTRKSVTVSFNGQAILGAPGQSVGAVLVSNGITSWRSTRNQERPRGLFCGIGICFDCLVCVDGDANQRACLVEVQEGMQIVSSTSRSADPQATEGKQK